MVSKLVDAVCKFRQHPVKWLKIVIVIYAVLVLFGLFFGLTLIHVTPDQQMSDALLTQSESRFWNYACQLGKEANDLLKAEEFEVSGENECSISDEEKVEVAETEEIGFENVGLGEDAVKSSSQTVVSSSKTGNNVAVIGVAVYWDSSLTNMVSAINWGDLVVGSQKSYTVYISNQGNSPLTLSVYTSNWNPEAASEYLIFSSNCTDQSIGARATVPVTLTLTVSPNITGIFNFSFDVVIQGVS